MRICKLNNQRIAVLLLVLDEKVENLETLKIEGPKQCNYVSHKGAIYKREDVPVTEIDAEITAIKTLHRFLFYYQRKYADPTNITTNDPALEKMLNRAKLEYYIGARKKYD